MLTCRWLRRVASCFSSSVICVRSTTCIVSVWLHFSVCFRELCTTNRFALTELLFAARKSFIVIKVKLVSCHVCPLMVVMRLMKWFLQSESWSQQAWALISVMPHTCTWSYTLQYLALYCCVFIIRPLCATSDSRSCFWCSVVAVKHICLQPLHMYVVTHPASGSFLLTLHSMLYLTQCYLFNR